MLKDILKKRIKRYLAVTLVVVIAILAATMVFADNQYVYVEDIKMATGTDEAAVKKQLTDAGYTVADRNLCDGNGQYAYLGYKTTDDVNEAITDIRLMNMSSGFKMMDYRALQSAYNVQLNSMAKQFMATVNEMEKNVAKDSPLALAGKELLDLLYFEASDGTHIPLSDYLFDDSRTLQDFIDINMMCNTMTLSVIFSALNLGVDDGKLVDAGTKFSNYDVITEDDGNSYASLDKQYSEYAKILSDEIVQFNESYKKGAVNVQMAPKSTAALESEEAQEIYEDGITSTFTADYSVKYNSAIEKSDKQNSDLPLYNAITEQSESEIVDNDDSYVLFVALYETMKDYAVPDGLDGSDYGNPQNLGDYLIGYADAVKGKEELSIKDLRYLYPLAASFTEGQRYVIKLNGIISMMLYLIDPSEKQDLRLTIEEKLKEDYLAELNQIEDEDIVDKDNRVNVFIGTNVDAYNKQVALTEACNREAAANALYEKLIVGESNKMKTVKKAFSIARICVLASAGALVLGLVGLYVTCGTISLYSAITLIAIGGSWLAGGTAVAGLICAVFSVVVAVVVVLAIIAFAIFAIWKWFLDDEKDEKENTPATYQTIPEEVYDYISNSDEYRFIGYEAVTDTTGKIADINNYKSVNAKSQWDVFYFTKNEAAGSPIVVNKLSSDALFIFSSEKFSDGKVMPLCRFGEQFATNIRSYQNKTTNNTLYIFFKTEKSVEGAEGGSPEEQGIYLQSLKIYSNKDSEAAKLFLINKKYEVIEKNLTPNTGMYTYIGFTTTYSEQLAIKDIRVAYGPASDDSSFQFGSYSYGCAGVTSNNIALYYSCIEGSGTPIYADLIISDNKDAAEENYEPVNLFSGGDAFDFCIQNGLSKDKWNNHIYIHFNPTEKFDSDSDDAKQYVDGFAFFITDSTNTQDVKSFMELNGFETFKVNGSGGKYYSNQKDICKGATKTGSTYMAVSTTANPYRAITDVGTYDASQSSKALFENINVGQQGYSVCETFMQYSGKRSIRECNAYVCGENGENGPNYYPEKITDAAYLTKKVINEEGEFDDLIYRGVYVKGPCEKTAPLELNDILFSETSQKIDGYRAVTNLYDGYGTNARNLVCEYKNPSYTYFTPARMTMPTLTRYTAQKCTFSHHLYMHIKGEQVQKGKYISNVYITTFDNEHSKGATDDTERFTDDYAVVSALGNLGRCEIRRINIAASSGKQSYTKTDSGILGADYYGNTSYICVQYTNNINLALRNVVVKQVPKFDEGISNTIDIDKVEFSRCGNTISVSDKFYCLYQSKNEFFGNPITDITANTVSLDNKYVPILSDEGNGISVGDYYLKYLRYEVKSGDQISESPRYFNKLNFVVADNKAAALNSLLQMGCTNYIDYNRNASVGGKNIYFGYSTTTDTTDKNIITSVICSHDAAEAGTSKVYNGLTYTCVNSYDLGNGSGSYLYVSTDKKANPVSAISLINGESICTGGKITENYFYDTSSFDSSNNNGFRIRYYPSNYWSYKKGVLTIKCYGDMPDYNDSYTAPWSKYAGSITEVIIESNVTSIDAQAFAGCTAIKTINIKNDVASGASYKDITIEAGAIPSGAEIIANANCQGVKAYLDGNSSVDTSILYEGLTGRCHNSDFTYELNANKLCIKGSGVLGNDSYTITRKKVYMDGGTGYTYITTKEKIHDYSKAGNTPWGEALAYKVSGINLSEYFKNITELEIEGDATSIATDFFKTLTSLKKITVKSISGTGYTNAFGNLSSAVCYGYLDSGFRQYCIDKGIEFHYITSQSTPSTAKKTAEQWEISGNTLILKKSGTYKNKGTDDCHANSEYAIDKSSIKHVLLYNTVKSLPYDSFNGYTNLKDIVIVSDADKMTTTDSNGNALVSAVTAIPNRCFKDCTSLKNYSIPSKVISIGDEAFSGCSSLAEITVPAAVKSVGADAFNGCSSIESVILPATVTSVGNGAFIGCKEGFKLTVTNPVCAISRDSIIVDKTATIIAPMNSNAYASAMRTGCNFVQLDSSENVSWKLSDSGKLTVSENGAVVNNWSNLKDHISEVEFASGVTSIPTGALKNYPNLTRVTLPSTLKEIPDSFCEGCTELKTVVIPNGIEKIGASAFKNCSKLDLLGEGNHTTGAIAYSFPDSIKEIGSYAFYGVYEAADTTSGIALPMKLEKIGERAITFKKTYITVYNRDCEFADMSITAKTLHFPASSQGTSNVYQYYKNNFDAIKAELGTSMWSYIIADFKIENNTVYIGVESNTLAFVEKYSDSSLAPWNKTSAENVVVSCGIILSNECFKGNRSIKTVSFKFNEKIANNVIIPQDCFRDCTNLKTIKLDNGVKIIKYGLSSFMNCSNLSFGHSMPDGAEYIDNFAFDKCEHLFTDYAALPETLTYIGSSAFSSNDTLTISLPRSLEKICNLAIYSPNWTVILNSPDCEIVTRAIQAKAIYSPEYPNAVAYFNSVSGSSMSPSKTMKTEYIAGWTLDTGTLAISGNHDMYDYPDNSLAPWYSMRNDIDTVVIEEGVTSIGKNAFNNLTNLKSITIAHTVNKIAENSMCSLPLKSIDIYGEDVSVSGNKIFGASKTTSVEIYCTENSNTYKNLQALGYSVKALSNEIYTLNEDGILKIDFCSSGSEAGWKESASSVTKVVIANSITEIPSSAFENFTNLKEVVLSSNLERISDKTFKNCTSLKSISIPKSVTKIGASAFENCTSLNLCDKDKCYAFGNNITVIGNRAFYGVMENTECYISLPKSLIKLGDNAICMKKSELYINNDATSFGENAFVCSSCYAPYSSTAYEYFFKQYNSIDFWTSTKWSFKNKTLTISETEIMPDYKGLSAVPWHEYADEIENIVVEEGVESIGAYAFNSLPNLKSISLPSTIRGIGAMSLCNLGEVNTIHLTSDIIQIVDENMTAGDKTSVKFTNANYSSLTWETLSDAGYSISYSASPVGSIFANGTGYVLVVALIILVIAVAVALMIKRKRSVKKEGSCNGDI